MVDLKTADRLACGSLKASTSPVLDHAVSENLSVGDTCAPPVLHQSLGIT